MRRTLAPILACALGMSTVLTFATARPAFAHEERTVGAYRFLVGWGEEPAYAGVKNSVQLILSTAQGKPVNDLADTLKVEVVFGSQRMTLPLVLNFDPDSGEGTPGDYRAWLIPTAAGDYSFRFTGSVGKQQVDETFRSGPSTFAPVADPSSVQFPVKEPPGSQVASLAQRVGARAERAASAAAQAKADANTAKRTALIGILAGAAGLLAAAAALTAAVRSRRGGARP